MLEMNIHYSKSNITEENGRLVNIKGFNMGKLMYFQQDPHNPSYNGDGDKLLISSHGF